MRERKPIDHMNSLRGTKARRSSLPREGLGGPGLYMTPETLQRPCVVQTRMKGIAKKSK